MYHIKSTKLMISCVCDRQIQEKLLQLTEKREEMMLKWDDRWDWLRLRE